MLLAWLPAKLWLADLENSRSLPLISCPGVRVFQPLACFGMSATGRFAVRQKTGGEGGIRIAWDPTTEKPKTTAFRLIVSGLGQAERCNRMQRGQAKSTRLANPWQISAAVDSGSGIHRMNTIIALRCVTGTPRSPGAFFAVLAGVAGWHGPGADARIVPRRREART